MSEFSQLKTLLLKKIAGNKTAFLAFKKAAGNFALREFPGRRMDDELPELLFEATGYRYEKGDMGGGLPGRVRALSAGQAGADRNVAIAIYLLFMKCPEYHHYVPLLEEQLFGTDPDTKHPVSIKDALGWEPAGVAWRIEREVFADRNFSRKEAIASLRSKGQPFGDQKSWLLHTVGEELKLGDMCSFSLFELDGARSDDELSLFLEVSALSAPDENGYRYGFNKLIVRLNFEGRHKPLLAFNLSFLKQTKVAENCHAILMDSGQVRRMCLSAKSGYLDGRFDFREMGHFFRLGPLSEPIDFSGQLTFNCLEESLVYRDGKPLPSANKSRLMALVNSERHSDADSVFGWRVLCDQKYSVRPNADGFGGADNG
ncbi:hypothetical protein ACSSV1_004888 [Labrenzia sp. MBR-25]